MNLIIPSVCALALLGGCVCPQQEVCYRPLPCSSACSDTFREPYRISYPPLGPVAELSPCTPPAITARRVALMRPGQAPVTGRLIVATSPAPVASVGGRKFDATGSLETPPPQSAPPVRAVPPVVASAPDCAVTQIPTAAPVPGKPGFVCSPFVPKSGLIDVQGVAPGGLAKDPYSGRIFRVP